MVAYTWKSLGVTAHVLLLLGLELPCLCCAWHDLPGHKVSVCIQLQCSSSRQTPDMHMQV